MEINVFAEMLFCNIRSSHYLFSTVDDWPKQFFQELAADPLKLDGLELGPTTAYCRGTQPLLLVQHLPRVLGYATADETPKVLDRCGKHLTQKSILLARLNADQVRRFPFVMKGVFQGESFEKRIGPGKLRRSFELFHGQHLTEIYLAKQVLPGIAMSA